MPAETTQLRTDSGPSSTTFSPISDICKKLSKLEGNQRSTGFLVDESTGQYRHNIHFLNKTMGLATDTTSLESLLKLSRQRLTSHKMHRRERLHIALVLASSVLQLDGTSWLGKHWGSADIYFLPSRDSKSEMTSVDYARPYVSCQVLSEDIDTALDPSENVDATRRFIPSEILLGLAITLIELSLEQNFREMQKPEDVVASNKILTNYNTASRLVDDVYNESGLNYGDVVRRCLTCPFDLRNLSESNFENDDFQEAVFDQIFIPLQQDFKNFNRGPNLL